MICLDDASLTFKILPLNGNTPYLSLPTTSIPDIANDFAESPSVIIRMQFSAFLVPASLASSNLGIPKSRHYFFDVKVLAILAYSLAFA